MHSPSGSANTSTHGNRQKPIEDRRSDSRSYRDGGIVISHKNQHRRLGCFCRSAKHRTGAAALPNRFLAPGIPLRSRYGVAEVGDRATPRRLKHKAGRAEHRNVAAYHHYAASIQTHRQNTQFQPFGLGSYYSTSLPRIWADFAGGMSSSSAEHVAVIAVRSVDSASG